MSSVRVHRIPFSTNCERISLACGVKGVAIDWVDHDPADRAPIRALSGQDLFPVLETPDGRFVFDSPVILDLIEEEFPDSPLLPAGAAEAAEVRTFCDWFNRVWKLAPNLMVDDPRPELAAELAASADRFEALLTGRQFLMGDVLTLADVTAFPFLRIPVEGLAPGDTDPFHALLASGLPCGPLTSAWVERVAALPHA